jgi:hypothetical protein
MSDKQQDIYSRRQDKTGEWLLEEQALVDWLEKGDAHPTIWCPGNRMYSCQVPVAIFLTFDQAGVGKTVMTYVFMLKTLYCLF